MRDWLSEAVRRHPDRPFVVVGDDEVTFGRMGKLVGEWIGAVRGAFEPGTRLGLWARNDLESVVSILAAPRAGLVPLLLNPRWTGDEVGRVMERAAADVLTRTVASGDFVEWGAPRPDSIHSVVFTSGSMGAPKGVRLTWGNLEASAAASAHHLRHTAKDRWLAVLPLCHVGGLSILTRSLRQGSPVVVEPRFDAARVASLLSGGGVTLVSLVAATLRAVLDERSTFDGVRAALVGGGPVPRWLVEEAWSRGLPVLPTYGMTETSSQVATASLTESDPEKLDPLPGVSISIVDGRIAVDGPMVSPGYLDEPDREPGRPFVTGDAGALDGGRLRVFGRADDVIVTGGENVHPAEVEARLREHPGVRDAAVAGIPDPTWGSIVGAMVEGDVDTRELSDHLALSLAQFKIPRRWLVVAELPRLEIGKIDRAGVAARLSGS